MTFPAFLKFTCATFNRDDGGCLGVAKPTIDCLFTPQRSRARLLASRGIGKKHLEICVLGLQSAGKTSLVNLLAIGQFSDEMVPTVGFNMRKVKSGNVAIKVWDIGGQPRFRSMWERYCRGVSAILFVVDSSIPISNMTSLKSDTASTTATSSNPWAIASEELHSLMSRPQLAGIPLLVLATKNDVKGAVSAEDVIREMKLETISNREVSCYSISSKRQVNIDVTLRWLCARSPSSAR